MGLLNKLFSKKKTEPTKKTNPSSANNDILMLSQLAAFYLKENDSKYQKRYINELMAHKVPQKDAQAMFDFDCGVIKKYGKDYLLHSNFTRLWFFGLKQPFFLNYPKTKDDILKEQFFTVSELCKIIDEAEWHFWNSHERELPEGVWEEIWEWRLQGAGGEFAIKYFDTICDVANISNESITIICQIQGSHLSKHKWR